MSSSLGCGGCIAADVMTVGANLIENLTLGGRYDRRVGGCSELGIRCGVAVYRHHHLPLGVDELEPPWMS